MASPPDLRAIRRRLQRGYAAKSETAALHAAKGDVYALLVELGRVERRLTSVQVDRVKGEGDRG